MSAAIDLATLVQVAATARLRASPILAGTGVFDAPPVRAALPHAVVDEPLFTDWSTKSWTGREAKLSVLVHDGGERPLRLRVLAAAVEEALLTLAGDLEGGWRVASAALLRSRIVRGGERWTAGIDVRVRLYRTNEGDE
jgi:hypothetical protein